MANWVWTETSTGSYEFGGTTAIAKGVTASAENVQFLFPATTRNYDISFSIAYESDPAEERTATISNVNLVMGKSYNINLVVNDKDIVTEEYKIEFFVTEVKDWGENIELDATVNEPGHGFENGYEWVDLGLSVKWATCNVGATTPEEYGDYFAWGEVEPKTTYSWSTYKYGSDDDQLTKYCTNSDYGKDGFMDNKTVLDPEDDAATVNWGGAWRMPTYDEMDELKTKCTWTWTTQNGVKGYKVTGPNGNSIFLPAAGYMNNSDLYGAGSGGDYWSSSLDTNGSDGVYGVGFYSDNVDGYYFIRNYGLSVRPVCP